LLLHLKRFLVEEQIIPSPEGNSDENSRPNSPQAPSYELVIKKNKAPVAIPANLSLDAFRVDTSDKQEQTTTSPLAGEYSLKSVVRHHGEGPSSGHYKADAIRLCEKEQEPGETINVDTGADKEMEERWVRFDDGNSTPTTLEQVTTNIDSQMSVYMVMYVAEEGAKLNNPMATAVPEVLEAPFRVPANTKHHTQTEPAYTNLAMTLEKSMRDSNTADDDESDEEMIYDE
jgi:hypothetical protein